MTSDLYHHAQPRVLPQPRVLIAEDEPQLGVILQQFLAARGFHVYLVQNGRDALKQLGQETIDVALVDLVMPELDGLEVLRVLRGQPASPEVIVVTGNASVETTVSALRMGAYDVITKPYRMALIEALVRRAHEKHVLLSERRQQSARAHANSALDVFITHYAPLKAVLAMAESAAVGSSPILMSGEAGSGRSHMAAYLHSRSERASGPFVEVDCRRESLVSLFGLQYRTEQSDPYEDVGRLEMARGGTLCLDHVEALEPELQARLSDILDSGHYRKVGSDRREVADLRLMASTSQDVQDLRALAASGKFNDALLHHLEAVRITLPPLRERAVDIVPLAQHLLRHFAGPSASLDNDAAAQLEACDWFGNLRELRWVMERAAMLSSAGASSGASSSASADTNGSLVCVEHLDWWPPLAAAAHNARGSEDSLASVDPAHLPGTSTDPGSAFSLAELEKNRISVTLLHCNWHQGRAARLLGISPKTLYRKIREYGFERPRTRGDKS